jgi:hypothetical protein
MILPGIAVSSKLPHYLCAPSLRRSIPHCGQRLSQSKQSIRAKLLSESRKKLTLTEQLKADLRNAISTIFAILSAGLHPFKKVCRKLTR